MIESHLRQSSDVVDTYRRRLGEFLRIDDAIKLGRSIVQLSDIARVSLTSETTEAEAQDMLEQLSKTNTVADVIISNLGRHPALDRVLGIGQTLASLRSLAKLTIDSPFSKPNTQALLSTLKTSHAQLNLTLTVEGPLTIEDVATAGDVGRALLDVQKLEGLTVTSRFAPGAIAEFFRTMAEMPNLNELSLVDTSHDVVTNDDAKAIKAALPALDVAILSVAALFDADISFIVSDLLSCDNPPHTLSLTFGALNEDDAVELGDLVCGCPGLTSLALKAVFDPQATFVLVDSLRARAQLTSLSIARTDITALSAPEAASVGVALGHMPSLTELSVESLCDERALEGLVAGLRFCGSLRHLRLRRLYDERPLLEAEASVVGDTIASLGRLTVLSVFDGFDDPAAADALMAGLASSPSLMTIDIQNDAGPVTQPRALEDAIRNNERAASTSHKRLSAMRQWVRRVVLHPTTTDFAIIVDDGVFLAHLDLLAARSGFFAHMCYSGMSEGLLRSVSFAGRTLAAIHPVLHFLYSGDCYGLFDELVALPPAVLAEVEAFAAYLQPTDHASFSQVVDAVRLPDGHGMTLRERRHLQKGGFRAFYADICPVLFSLQPHGRRASFFRGHAADRTRQRSSSHTHPTHPTRPALADLEPPDPRPVTVARLRLLDRGSPTTVTVPSCVVGLIRGAEDLAVSEAVAYLGFCLGPRSWEMSPARPGSVSHIVGFPDAIVNIAVKLGHAPVLYWCRDRVDMVWAALTDEERAAVGPMRAALDGYRRHSENC